MLLYWIEYKKNRYPKQYGANRLPATLCANETKKARNLNQSYALNT
jgi:hypothetical protein